MQALKKSHAINAPFVPWNMLLKAPPQAAVNIELLLKRPVFGIPPGPQVGAALRQLLEWVTETPAVNERDRLLAELARMRTNRRGAFD